MTCHHQEGEIKVIDDELEKVIRGTGQLARKEAKKFNPDLGSICYMKDNEVVLEYVDGRIVILEDINKELKRLRKRNNLLSRIEELRKNKYNLSKYEIDDLFQLVDRLEEIVVSYKLQNENKENEND